MAEKSIKFFALIDRLKVCSEKKYPERKWTEEFYQYTSFIWIGLESELEARVLKLENELQIINKMDAFAITKPRKEKYIIQVEFDGEITTTIVKANFSNTLPFHKTKYASLKTQFKVIEVDLDADTDSLTDLFNKTASSIFTDFVKEIATPWNAPAWIEPKLTYRVTVQKLGETTSNTNINLEKTNYANQ